jgi:hypothetical protein
MGRSRKDLQDRFDQLQAQEGKVDKATDVATGNAVAPGEVLQRLGAAGGQLLKPRAPARDRLDQRRITFWCLVLPLDIPTEWEKDRSGQRANTPRRRQPSRGVARCAARRSRRHRIGHLRPRHAISPRAGTDFGSAWFRSFLGNLRGN